MPSVRFVNGTSTILVTDVPLSLLKIVVRLREPTDVRIFDVLCASNDLNKSGFPYFCSKSC